MECISKKLQFKDIIFKSEWYYHNPITDFHYKSGFIPGELLYSEFSGDLSFHDLSKIEQTLNSIYREAQFDSNGFIRIVDYSRVVHTDLVLRKAYVDMINRLNKKFNCAPVQTWICGANDLIRISIILLTSATKQRLLFAKSVQDAFSFTNSASFDSEMTANAMHFDQSDIYQISKLFNHLIFDQMYPSPYIFSDDQNRQYLQLSSLIDVTKKNNLDFKELDKLDYDSVLTILESVQAGVIIIDASNCKIVFCNQAAAQLSTTTPDKLQGKVCTTLCIRNPSTCPLLTIEDKSIDNIETLLRCSDGMQIPIMKSVKKLFYNGKPYFLETFIDIKERKNTESELRKERDFYEKTIQENHDFLEDVFHSIQDGVFVLNEDYTIRHQNDVMKSWYNGCNTFSGKKCHVLFHNSDTPCDGCPTIRCFESKQTETAILAGRKNSNIKWVEVYSYPLKNRETNEITGAIVFIRDITKRKIDEEYLRKTNLLLEKQSALANTMAEQARKASEAKSEFLANMSHEIRTPMNGLIGITSLLSETPLNDEQLKYLEIIRSCGNSLLILINDILDFSKIEAGRLEIESIDFDLCLLIKNFTEMISQRVHEKSLEFIIDLSPDIPYLLNGDPHRFQQVLTNLVGNAIKFTQEGEIIIRGEIIKDDENEAILKFSIQDSGIGIPAEKQNILFNKFTQVDNSPTRRYGGTGLGLAISKQLVTLMGGEIGIISPVIDHDQCNSPHGSEFWFTIKFKKQGSQKTCLSKPTNFDNISVLIIDKNDSFRRYFIKTLNKWNISVTDASSIHDAVFLLQNNSTDHNNYDIIFVSQTTSDNPPINHFIQQFKTSFPGLKSNIVLLASSLHDVDTSSFSAVLHKPVFTDVLYNYIYQYVHHTTGTPLETHKAHSTFNIPLKNAKVLLVEDNIVNQKVAMGLMKKWNLSVDTAMNGLEALTALSRQKYDIVFMDVQMPELDGFETTRKIRKGESNVLDQKVPVIAMTAHTMCGDKEECISAGMNDYIPKPFNVDNLFTVLNKWLCSKSKSDSVSFNEKQTDPCHTNEQRCKLFDKDAFSSRMRDDSELIHAVLRAYITDSSAQMKAFAEALETDRLNDCVKIAHTLRGASSNVNAEELCRITTDIETACKECNTNLVRNLFQTAQEIHTQLKHILNQIINQSEHSKP